MARRWPALLVISMVLVGAGIVDRGHAARQARSRDKAKVQLDQPVAAPMAVAAPAGALSSTWYCAAGTATKGGAADIMVAVANPGPQPLQVEVTVVPDKGPSRSRMVTAPARSRVRVLLRTIVTARFAAALVEVRGGGVSVEREVSGPDGYDAGPCASSSSDRWYFAAGSTLRGANEYLALFNPYPDDTSVDMRFFTERGSRTPRRLRAFPVPGRSLRIVHLNAESVNRHAVVAAQILARSGRLVVDRLQVFDGSGDPTGSPSVGDGATPAPRGLSVATGASRPVTLSAFPAGRKLPGAREQIVVSNPSARDASVDVGVALDSPGRNGELDPFPLSVPAHDVKVLDLTDQATVPDDVDHSVTVVSRNGVAVVAEQVLTGGEPWSRVGASMTGGSSLEATRWVFAAGGVTPDKSELLVIQNLSGRTRRVDITALVGTKRLVDPELRNIEVPGSGRTTIRLDRLERPSLPVEVRASGPVVAARAIYLSRRPGISIALGVPLQEGARIPVMR